MILLVFNEDLYCKLQMIYLSDKNRREWRFMDINVQKLSNISSTGTRKRLIIHTTLQKKISI